MDNLAVLLIKPSEFINQVADVVADRLKAQILTDSNEKDNLTQAEACNLECK